MTQFPDESSNSDAQPTSFVGPANWFSLDVAPEISLQQTEAFLELKPKAAVVKGHPESSVESRAVISAWSLTLYAAWVDKDEPETHAASFDPTSLFPDVVRSERGTPLPIDAFSRSWSGLSRHKSNNWWTSMFQRRRSYEWQLWVIEHDSIIIVASLQSASGKPLSRSTVATCEATLGSIEFAETLAKPPELFRRDVLALAHKHFPLLKSENAGVFAVRIAESEINLANFYRSYIQQPHRLKEIVLPGIATVVRLQEWGPDQLMPPLDTVADRVMPMLYSDIDADASLDGFVRLPWVGGLSVMFVLDEDDTYRFVHERMLERWDISPDELQKLAMENLEEFTQENPLEVTLIGEEENPRMLVPVEPDAYNSVRLLGDDLHRRLRELLGPELIVGVPNRDFFVAVSLSHPALVGQVQQRVIQDYQSMHHPLTSRLLVISADGVSEYVESES